MQEPSALATAADFHDQRAGLHIHPAPLVQIPEHLLHEGPIQRQVAPRKIPSAWSPEAKAQRKGSSRRLQDLQVLPERRMPEES